MHRLIKLMRRIIRQYRLYRDRKLALKYEGKYLYNFSSQKLTKNELYKLQKSWGVLGLKLYHNFYQMYKSCEGFNPLFLSDDLYYPYILRALNQLEYSIALCHKGYYESIFYDVKQPETIIKRVRGCYFDNKNQIISEEQAYEHLLNSLPFIIKPTIDTSTGKNVFKVSDIEELTCIDNLFDKLGSDFIAQKVLIQSEQTSVFNPESLNTVRVSTLFINGVFSICNMAVRMGRRGSVVDNLGAGGLMVGINDDGTLREYAYDSFYNKYYECNDLVFKSLKLNGIDRIKAFAEYLHVKKLPNMGFVGWDIALDKDDEPVLIEANLKWPGIQFEQLAAGKPLFTDRTDEVIEFVKKFYEE